MTDQYENQNPDAQVNHPDLWRHALPVLTSNTHKYKRGHSMIIGGDVATGAARLASRAALRAGSGLVSICCSAAAFPLYASAVESVMVKPERADLEALLTDERLSGLCIGPGLGHGEQAQADILCVLDAVRPTVLDADALTAFTSDSLRLFRALHPGVILTPHGGEFPALFGREQAGAEDHKPARTLSAAITCGSVVVYKGAQTVIASPDGRLAVNNHASPYLATAGSGDVLSGIITGLCAQGMPAFEAACAAVWLHGDAALAFGPGLIAEDLPDLLPAAFRRLAD